MILKGSQRGGASQLAAHLLRTDENEHVELVDVRGFVSRDLHGALAEASAVASGTKCKQFMFSLSVSPPKDAHADIETMTAAAERAEAALGLTGQPRAIVVHEKDGRRHLHAVWSRIDAAEMKAFELPFYKNKLCQLSKDLYLEHGWELPEGHRENGWKSPFNFTLAEWQQAKRVGLHPQGIKQQFQEAWKHSDGLRAFKAALEDRGYFLAKGDRRGFVAVDVQGEVFAIARQTGAKTKDVAARLGSPDDLPSVDTVREQIRSKLGRQLRDHLKAAKAKQAQALRPVAEERKLIVAKQREERAQLRQRQEVRRVDENRGRQARMRKGWRGLFDILTGRAAATRRENERDAEAGRIRDRAERERLVQAQLREREEMQRRLEELRRQQRQERTLLFTKIAAVLALQGAGREPAKQPQRKTKGLDLQ